MFVAPAREDRQAPAPDADKPVTGARLSITAERGFCFPFVAGHAPRLLFEADVPPGRYDIQCLLLGGDVLAAGEAEVRAGGEIRLVVSRVRPLAARLAIR